MATIHDPVRPRMSVNCKLLKTHIKLSGLRVTKEFMAGLDSMVRTKVAAVIEKVLTDGHRKTIGIEDL